VAVAVQIFQQAVFDMLQVFGYEPVKNLLDDIAGLAANALPASMISAASGAIDALDNTMDTLCDDAEGEFSAFRARIATTGDQINQVIDRLRPVMGALRRLAELELLQPGALEGFLREKLQDILDVKVNETQKIDDPFNALFDRIDAAVDAVDFSSVAAEVRGFFEQIQSAITGIDLPNISGLIGTQLEQLSRLIDELQAGVNQLLSAIQQHFGALADQARELAGQFGSFDAGGEFHFNFEAELQQVLEQARHALAGNPDDPPHSARISG
jgi:methyl-accepting chemotaxis protein